MGDPFFTAHTVVVPLALAHVNRGIGESPRSTTDCMTHNYTATYFLKHRLQVPHWLDIGIRFIEKFEINQFVAVWESLD